MLDKDGDGVIGNEDLAAMLSSLGMYIILQILLPLTSNLTMITQARNPLPLHFPHTSPPYRPLSTSHHI